MSQPGSKTITLPDEDWLIIDQALQRMPYGQVAGVYQRINPQFAEQRESPLEAAKSEPASDGLRLTDSRNV